MHGNSKIKMLQRVIDLQKWLKDTPEGSQQALWYQAEIDKLMLRIYR